MPLALAATGDADPALSEQLGYRTLEEREHWLALFAQAGFGTGPRRLWIWRRDEPLAVPPVVGLDGVRVELWKATPPEVAVAPSGFTLAQRVRGRIGRERLKRRVRAAQGRAERR